MTCHRTRLLTLDEAREAYGNKIPDDMAALLQQYGGQIITGELQAHNHWSGEVVMYYEHDGRVWSSQCVRVVTTHQWIDNGCQRSWCRVCDVDGVWDRATGKYVVK